jgi:hypothetical protein
LPENLCESGLPPFTQCRRWQIKIPPVQVGHQYQFIRGQVSSHIAFKEWAVVVDALRRGEQVLIVRP